MKKYILSLIALTSLYNCNLDRLPNDGVITENVINSDVGLNQALNGVYEKLRGFTNSRDGLGSYGGITINMFRNGTFGADEINLSGTTTDPFMTYYDLVRNESNARTNIAWNDGFQAIYSINSILKNLPEGGGLQKDHLLGEAYYLRAFVNFNMLLHYSKMYYQGPGNLGIPLKKTVDENDRPLRATVGESYDAVVADLLKAESLMANDSKNNIKATQAAAQALLSRVYLYMDNNNKALEYANKVINSGRYVLVPSSELPTYAGKVPEQNTETIFAFKFENNPNMYSSDYALGSMYIQINGQGWGEMYAADPYVRQLEMFPTDLRNKFIEKNYTSAKSPVVYWTEFKKNTSNYQYVFYPATVNAQGVYTSFKINGTDYPIQTETLDYGGNSYEKKFAIINGIKQYLTCDFSMNNRSGYPKFFVNKLSRQEGVSQLYSPVISRLAEMYLIRAEVNARAGNVNEALLDINVIRRRANAPEFKYLPAGKNIMDIVLEERWLELAYEGHRKFDLIRNKRPIDRRFPGVHLNEDRYKAGKEIIQPTDNDLVFFIPIREINNQPGLQQND